MLGRDHVIGTRYVPDEQIWDYIFQTWTMCALQAVHGTSSIRHNKGYASAQCVNDGMTLINVNVLRRARNIKQLRKWRKTLIWWMSRGYDGLQLHSKLVSGCRFVASRSSGGITLLQRNMTYVSGYLRTYIYKSDCVGVEASRLIWLFRRGTRKWRARWLQTRLWWAGGSASTAWERKVCEQIWPHILANRERNKRMKGDRGGDNTFRVTGFVG